jgi:hypothetical protein
MVLNHRRRRHCPWSAPGAAVLSPAVISNQFQLKASLCKTRLLSSKGSGRHAAASSTALQGRVTADVCRTTGAIVKKGNQVDEETPPISTRPSQGAQDDRVTTK